MQSNYLSLYTLFFSHSLFYAYCPYQRFFALWLILLSLPFNFKDRFARLRFALASQQAKKNISKNRSFCQAPFAFFSFYFLSFFHPSEKKQNISNTYRLHTETSKRIITFCCFKHCSVLSTPTCTKQVY